MTTFYVNLFCFWSSEPFERSGMTCLYQFKHYRSMLPNWDSFVKLWATIDANILLPAYEGKKKGSTLMKIYHFDDNISVWWDFMAVHLKIILSFRTCCDASNSFPGKAPAHMQGQFCSIHSFSAMEHFPTFLRCLQRGTHSGLSEQVALKRSPKA